MKLNWGSGIAIVYTLFAAGMILFAVIASRQNFDLVTDNYYEEAVNYQKKIDAGNNAVNSESKLSITYLKTGNAIEISTDGKIKSTIGMLSFYKPDKASDDFKLNFSTDDSGKQLIPLKKLAHGYWKINASWNLNGKDCFEVQKIFIP
ncbi:MAG: FixH family protein [Bacteroidia bacterium]